jgi:ectoine hydroxylase-related dioxygenase (phytanoyl-CoA dioxygenase family)
MVHDLEAADEIGALGVRRLKRIWRNAISHQPRDPHHGDPHDFHLDHLVLDALGIGLEQTLQYLARSTPTFEEFERWIVATAGGVCATQVERINAAVAGESYSDEVKRRLAAIDAAAPVLSAQDLAFWDEHGYLVLHDAVSRETREAAAAAVWEHLRASADEPQSWYRNRPNSIMVQYFQHPAFTAIRRSERIHKAFAQLWGTADLWATTDRVGFNAPEREGWHFPGPHLHWDESIATPIPFGVQGILYLTDTPAEQGAFTCVPGFHRRIESWLAALPADADPRRQDLHALGSQPIAGRAGDLVIWHHALPHGSRPNRGRLPRIVQYITMRPTRVQTQAVWK